VNVIQKKSWDIIGIIVYLKLFSDIIWCPHYAAMSHDVLIVMDVLKITKADFMGYSMGAYLLGHHPERFTSRVLGGIGNETELSAAQGSVNALPFTPFPPGDRLGV
jgi:pimeloyl-ACP methyl ester carboxylesterase